MMRSLVLAMLGLVVATHQLHAQLDFGGITRTDATSPTELPEVLKPLAARSEADEDQLTAAAHYAQGRLLHAKKKTALALQHYQRAWRYDSTSQQLLAEIVPVAFEAGQSDAAVRYAVIAAERNPKDDLLIRRLAVFLTNNREYERAIGLYEKALNKDAQLKNGMPEDITAATVYGELARLYYLTEKYEAAAGTYAILRRAVEDKNSHFDEAARKSILGDAAKTYSQWGESFLEAGKYDDAATVFKQANEAKEDKTLLAFRLARVTFAQNKLEEARKHLEEYFAAKNDSAGDDPYELLRKIILKQEKNPAAAQEQFIQRLRELNKEQPENISLAFALADALWTTRQFDTAIPLLTKTLQQQLDATRYAKLIEHLWHEKQYRELLAVAGQLAEQKNSLTSIEKLVLRLKDDAGLVKGCISLTREQAASTEPKPTYGPILAAAILAREAGQLKEADELFGKVLELAPQKTLDLQVNWAEGLFLAEQHRPAIEMYRQILAAKPRKNIATVVNYYLASALAMAGDTDEALTAIRIACEGNPDNPRYESRVGWIYYHAERWPEARAEYEKLLKKYGEKQNAETRQVVRSARMVLSNLALETNDFPQAVERLEQVLDEYPEDAGALNDLGYLWADRGLHLQRALLMTQRAVELEPENKSYRDSLGWALYRVGRFDEAVRELTSATTFDPAAGEEEPDGVLLDHLGDAFAKQGKPAEAKRAWQRAAAALEKAKELKKLDAVRQKLKAAS
ncbi:tetratricopeptide repeat protein [Anatilimnocola floriformis]|uniref:tetratricopeptide repeat protein n=1 Tax=Anatilimnocola floriformis TaxID=2948575 RepID=UPI0020C424A1|nr:tetratricopeptide repeat protein [Anatilimnocola floriformis]